MLCVLFFDMVNGSLGLGKVLVLVSIYSLFLEMGLFQGGFVVVSNKVIKMGGVLEKEYQNDSLVFENELIWGLLGLGGDKSENGRF